MSIPRAVAWLRALISLLVLQAGLAQAQPAFDVPFVPSPQVVLDEMLRLAGVKPSDLVMDLGSGDGRIPITAARKFGARGLGVELDETLVYQSEESARQAGVSDRVKFLQQDLFKTDLSQADVITMYLLPKVMIKLRPQLLELKPGTRIVAHDFELGDWKPDYKVTIRKNVFLWIVPAKVGGRWDLQAALPGGEYPLAMELRQRHQEIDGLVKTQIPAPLWEAKLEGDRIRFAIVDSRDREDEATLYFEGRVTGGLMEGTVRRGVGAQQTTHAWRARRVGP